MRATVAEDERHSIRVGATVFAGLYFLFLVERGMNFFLHGAHGHAHSHGHRPQPSDAGDTDVNANASTDSALATKDPDASITLKGARSVAWMIIIGDGFHNFVDGLALGAAFNVSNALGWSTFLAVLFHELPHEIGALFAALHSSTLEYARLCARCTNLRHVNCLVWSDACPCSADFAILLESGFTWRKALLWNLLSAATAYLGYIVGVATVSTIAGEVWVLAFTAGMFLYIALTDLVRFVGLLRPGPVKRPTC